MPLFPDPAGHAIAHHKQLVIFLWTGQRRFSFRAFQQHQLPFPDQQQILSEGDRRMETVSFRNKGLHRAAGAFRQRMLRRRHAFRSLRDRGSVCLRRFFAAACQKQ